MFVYLFSIAFFFFQWNLMAKFGPNTFCEQTWMLQIKLGILIFGSKSRRGLVDGK